jgi:hypothetical protein
MIAKLDNGSWVQVSLCMQYMGVGQHAPAFSVLLNEFGEPVEDGVKNVICRLSAFVVGLS